MSNKFHTAFNPKNKAAGQRMASAYRRQFNLDAGGQEKVKPSAKNRSTRECKCDAVAKWGYQAFFWRGKKWHQRGVGQRTSQGAVAIVKRFQTILITCRGCGSEMLREYP